MPTKRALQHDVESNWVYEEWVCVKAGVSPRFLRRRASALMSKAIKAMGAAQRAKKKALRTLSRDKATRAMRKAQECLRILDEHYSR